MDKKRQLQIVVTREDMPLRVVSYLRLPGGRATVLEKQCVLRSSV